MVVVANEFTYNGNLRIPQPQVQQIVNIMLSVVPKTFFNWYYKVYFEHLAYHHLMLF